MSVDDRLMLARDLARRAGALLREGYGQALEVRLKGPIDPVTQYDLRSEALLTEGIRQAFPGDAILAEEGGASGQGVARWVVDPLDGTINFAHGVPFFAVSIAYVDEQGQSKLGVVYDPLRDELFHAAAGLGAWLNGARLHPSTTRSLGDSLLVTGFPYDIQTTSETNLDHYAAFALLSQGVRRMGAASLDLAYVAAGRFDGYWELSVEAWDLAAGMLLVEEAGGRVTRADGGPGVLTPPITVLATNGHLHAAMLAVLDGKG